MPTAEELNALPYSGGSAFSAGLTGKEFEDLSLENGYSFRYWESFDARGLAPSFSGPNGEVASRDGQLYIERDVSGLKVMLWQTKQELDSPEFGLIRVGTTMVSYMPDQMALARNDRLLILSTAKTLTVKRTVTATGTATTVLPDFYPVEVLRVLADGEFLNPSQYSLNGNVISWQGTPPNSQLLLRLNIYPLYKFLGNVDQRGPMGRDGRSLPASGALTLVSSGEE